MLIRKLILHNYSIHADLELTFTPGINGIVGPNGSGKSTILDALRFVVTGSSILEGKLADNVSWGEKSGYVRLEFLHGDSEYVIERRVGKTAGQTLTTPTGPITKQAEIQQILEGLFGATFESLLNNVFVPQGRIEAILFATNTQRLREIQRIVGLDNLSLAEKALGLEVNSIQLTVGLKEQIVELAGKAAQATKEQAELDAQLKQMSASVALLQPYAKRLESFLATETSRAALQKVESDIKASELKVVELEGECTRLRLEEEAVTRVLASFEGKVDEAARQLAAIDAAVRQASVLRGIRAKVAEAEAVLKAAATPLPDVESLKTDLDKLRSTLDLRVQQLRGDLPRPRLPREEEIDSRLRELDVQLRGLLTVPPPSEEERELSSRIKEETHNCEVFGTGVCPTCKQDVHDFDPTATELLIKELRKQRQELEASRTESYEAIRRGLLAEQRELQQELQGINVKAKAILEQGVEKLKAQVEGAQAAYGEAHTMVAGVRQAERDLTTYQHQLQELGVPEDIDPGEAEKLRKVLTLYESAKVRHSEAVTHLKIKTGEKQQADTSLAQARSLREGFGNVESVDAASLAEARQKTEELRELTAAQQQVITTLGVTQARVQSLTDTVERLKGQYINEANARKWVTFCKRVRDIVHVNGLPTLMMREYATVLNRRIAHYLDVWESPFSMELDESLSFVSRFEDGRTHSASRLSGGQQIVASTSFRLAMVETFARELGLLVLDEPSNYLDTDNIYHLQQLLLRMRETTCDTGRQILLVTHEASLGGFFDHTISLYR
jgi:DNA repair protein SbcC/Rad50